MSPWTPVARARGLATRQERRAAKRAAQGLPYEPIGQGKPRRSKGGTFVPRGITPLQAAVREVRYDLERGYVNPARNMARTEYKLRAVEFEVYRDGWSTIKQAIEDGVADLL